MRDIRAIKHVYKAVKFNKCDTQYLIEFSLPIDSSLTERVKVEAFQGFSRAYNLAEYFRLRGSTSWKTGEQVTGLWKSNYSNVFYGDRKTKEGKTLILFFRSKNHEELTVYTYQTGYYPSKNKIQELISALR